MGDNTAIEWTDATWTPIRARNKRTGRVGWHCTHATPGCEHCYSESLNLRLGTGLPFKPGHEKDVALFLDEKLLGEPLRWRRPRRVFVCSMTDLFADFVPDEWIDRIFAVMAATPQHQFQVLTKRSARMQRYVNARIPAVWSKYDTKDALKRVVPPRPVWPLPNVWLGVSAEDQERADARLFDLVATPSAVRFVSAEPLLGPVDLSRWLAVVRVDLSVGPHWTERTGEVPALGWIIVGGESGRGARSMDLAWARSIVAQCAAAGVACFVKQLGARPVQGGGRANALVTGFPVRSSKGGDPTEWPDDLRVREMPQ